MIGVALFVAVLVGIYFYSRFNPEDYRFFPKCPVQFLTGYKCPGCGSQRAFYHLFQGNITTAFRYNPLLLALIPYLLTGIYVEYIAKKSNPYTIYIRKLLFNKWSAILLFVIIALYTILRNQPSTVFF